MQYNSISAASIRAFGCDQSKPIKNWLFHLAATAFQRNRKVGFASGRERCITCLTISAVTSVVQILQSVLEVWVRIPGRSNRTQCRQWLATAATFLWICVAQARSRGDGPRYSLHDSA